MQCSFWQQKLLPNRDYGKIQASAMHHGFCTSQRVAYLKYEVVMTFCYTERTFPEYISFSAVFASQDVSKQKVTYGEGDRRYSRSGVRGFRGFTRVPLA
jgi:hypothetical protein